MVRAQRLGLSALSGLMLFLACPDFDLWPLMWVALLPALHVALTSTTPRRAFLHGWLTGVVGNTGGFYWMLGLFQRFGHMPTWEALPIMMLLTTYQGLQFGLWSWGMHRLTRRTGRPATLLAPLLMAAIELLVPQIFPFYLAISQAWTLRFIQIADLAGPIGVGFVMMLTTGALYDAGRLRSLGLRHALRPLGVAAAVIVAVLVYGSVRIAQIEARRDAAPKARVGLVQANVGIMEKFVPGLEERQLALHQALSARLQAQGADLVVWPESSYPYALRKDIKHDFPDDHVMRVQRGFHRPLVFGAVTRQVGGDPRSPQYLYPYNTALMMDADGDVTGSFDKVFLLVFGEYIPFYERIPWFRRLFPEASNFNRGKDPAVFPFRLGDRTWKLGPLICYEDILPGFTRRLAGLRPNLFVNITNDAWFGHTSEPHQHLALAVFRTVEHRLEMVRAVNTGVSAHIDATGRVRQVTASVDPVETPDAGPATLLVETALLEADTVYGRVGDAFGFLCVGALIALAWRRRVTASA